MTNPFPFDTLPYPPRDWQVEAVDAAIESMRAKRRDVIQACTGAGKTAYTCALVRTICRTLKPNHAVVVSVPSQKLVEQTYKALRSAVPGGNVGRFYGRGKEYARVVVACQPSLPVLADGLMSRGVKAGPMVVDEMHRSDTDSVWYFRDALDPKAITGMTATPFKAQQDMTIRGWDSVAYSYPVDRALDDGVIVPWRPVLWWGEDDYDPDLATLEMIQKAAPPGPGVVSATSIDDAEWYAGWLTERGVPALAIHSRQSEAVQKKRIADLKAGRIRCLVHVEMLTEGVDFPWLRWLAMRKDRKSAVAIVQEVGRPLRLLDPAEYPEQVRLYGPKTEAVILCPRPSSVRDSLGMDPSLGDFGESLKRSVSLASKSLEPNPGAVVISPAMAAPEVGSFAEGMVGYAESVGLVVAPSRVATQDRALPITGDQHKRIKARLNARGFTDLSAIQEKQRLFLKRAMGWADCLTRGSADDILRLIDAVGSERARQARLKRRMPRKANRRWMFTGTMPEPPSFDG